MSQGGERRRCRECRRIVGVHANGKIRPHYGPDKANACKGTYTVGIVLRSVYPEVRPSS